MEQAEQRAMDGSEPHIQEPYIDIQFQFGPVKENGVNGTTIERVIDLLVDRLQGFQAGPFKCEENDKAIKNLKNARFILDGRTRKRVAQGVEGMNEAHREQG